MPLRSLSCLSEDLIVGLGHPAIFRGLNGLRLVLALATIYFGVTQGGIVGVALVMAAATFVSFALGWAVVGNILEASFIDYRRSVSGPLAAGAIAAVASLGMLRILPIDENLPAVLAASALVLAVYVASWFLLDRNARGEWGRLLTGIRSEDLPQGSEK